MLRATSKLNGSVLDWAGDALEAIRQILAEPEKKIPDAFLVQQGNIWTAYVGLPWRRSVEVADVVSTWLDSLPCDTELT